MRGGGEEGAGGKRMRRARLLSKPSSLSSQEASCLRACQRLPVLQSRGKRRGGGTEGRRSGEEEERSGGVSERKEGRRSEAAEERRDGVSGGGGAGRHRRCSPKQHPPAHAPASISQTDTVQIIIHNNL